MTNFFGRNTTIGEPVMSQDKSIVRIEVNTKDWEGEGPDAEPTEKMMSDIFGAIARATWTTKVGPMEHKDGKWWYQNIAVEHDRVDDVCTLIDYTADFQAQVLNEGGA